MQGRQMRLRDAVFPSHLADHELGIATDRVGPSASGPSLALLQMSEEEHQGLIFRDVIAPLNARGRTHVRNFAHDFGILDNECSSHRAFVPELVPRACPIEETKDARLSQG
jgi:hypothetical protein